MPQFGSITIERSMQNLCRTASMLLGAGLRLPMTMDIIIQSNNNRVIRHALELVRDGWPHGEGLSQPMSEIPLFPTLLVEMTSVGEKAAPWMQPWLCWGIITNKKSTTPSTF